MADLLAIHDHLFGAEATELQRRVKAQILVTAAYVLAEPPDTPNHANRFAWAHEATSSLRALELVFERCWMGFCLDPLIQQHGNAATDAEIGAVMAMLLDTDFAAGRAAEVIEEG